MRFKTLHDYDSEMLQLSGPYTDCDWPIYYAIRLQYLEEYVGEREAKEMGGRYCVSLLIVSPNAVPEKERESALRSCGWEDSDGPISWEKMNEEQKCELLISYGTYATIKELIGNNKSKLFREVRKELPAVNMLTGFYLDQPQNRIGASGWDFIQGNPLGQFANASMKQIVENAVARGDSNE